MDCVIDLLLHHILKYVEQPIMIGYLVLHDLSVSINHEVDGFNRR